MTEHENDVNQRRSRQAADFYVHLKDEFSLRVLLRWIVWLLKSWANVKEYVVMCRQDEILTRAMSSSHAAQSEPSNLPSNVTHVNFRKGASLSPERTQCCDQRPMSKRTSTRWLVGGGIAAAIIAIPCMIYLADSESSIDPARIEMSQDVRSIDAPSDTLTTPTDSSPQTQRLSDGTEVTLEAGTTMRVRFTPARRDIHLLEGRATFRVAHEINRANRPFVVNTYLGRVTALGTKFAVGLDVAGMEVRADEGEVEIVRRNGRPGSEFRLKGGDPPRRIPADSLAANGPARLGAAAPRG